MILIKTFTRGHAELAFVDVFFQHFRHAFEVVRGKERGDLNIHLNDVVSGGKSRLRPVLMTTLTTILGMVPMAIGGGQGSEIWQPMGVAVIGGLTVSTLLTLVIVPVLYCVFAGVGIKRQRRKHRKAINKID